ncbi:hypothetical protein QA612_04080 [Evansella sp. AB-P1]|uniref:hypothetical protein n=1 Tax=Evansella sp. AB-P1 TaxID=3037653 RepID=UPI00241F8015|nr:hypothetical protein [Evansella sp. AB-P1]MDG5786658.1 hypothetical protein [Evansella sp. AB-P1]
MVVDYWIVNRGDWLMTGKLTDAQKQFLHNYSDLLGEVEKTLQFVSECYMNGDLDIGDRLLNEVMKGLVPYNVENMTIVSIFGSDELGMKRLTKFQESVKEALKVEETFDGESDRLPFLHETLQPSLQKWKQVVEVKLVELKDDTK